MLIVLVTVQRKGRYSPRPADWRANSADFTGQTFLNLWAVAVAADRVLAPLLRVRDWFRDLLAGHVRSGQQDGSIRCDADPRATAIALLGMLRGVGIQLVSGAAGASAETWIPSWSRWSVHRFDREVDSRSAGTARPDSAPRSRPTDEVLTFLRSTRRPRRDPRR